MTSKELEARREALAAELSAITAKAVEENRGLSDEEKTARTEKRAAIETLDERIVDVKADEAREAKTAEARKTVTPVAHVTSEANIYGPGSRHSYLLDLTRAEINHGDGDGGVDAARERLARHAQELAVDLPERAKRGVQTPFEKRTNPNRTDGQGGYFVPPVWLIDQYIPLPRAGRPFANAVHNMDLPAGTDSINIPKVSTGTATGIQTADGASVTSTDLTDTSVAAPVRTIAGQQDVALQLLDQSPIAFDQVVFSDLLRDYASKVDVQTLTGSGSSGQLKGLDNVSGIIAQAYTDASPTVGELYPIVLGAVSQIATNLLDAASDVQVFMHPRRWYWMLGAVDSSSRPLVVPNPNGTPSFNTLGQGSSQAFAQGPAGHFGGLPVTLDPNISTTDTTGGGTNQDVIYVVATDKVYLWEGALRSRALQEVLSGTLQVRLQVYNYLAFMADRLPKATARVAGTGLNAPSGF